MSALQQNLTDNRFKKEVEKQPSHQTTVEEGRVLPKEREQLLKALNYLRSLEADWDGHGSEPPSPASIEITDAFIKAYPWLHHASPEQISPGMDGSLILKWRLASGGVLALTIDGIHLGLNRINANGSVEDTADVKFLPGAFFPADIQRHLPTRR